VGQGGSARAEGAFPFNTKPAKNAKTPGLARGAGDDLFALLVISLRPLLAAEGDG